VELFVEWEGDAVCEREEGLNEGGLVFLGGVCGENKVGWVTRCVGDHFAVVLGGVHYDCSAPLVCGENGYNWDLAEVGYSSGFFRGDVGR
jgi:hypothetical protein